MQVDGWKQCILPLPWVRPQLIDTWSILRCPLRRHITTHRNISCSSNKPTPATKNVVFSSLSNFILFLTYPFRVESHSFPLTPFPFPCHDSQNSTQPSKRKTPCPNSIIGIGISDKFDISVDLKFNFNTLLSWIYSFPLKIPQASCPVHYLFRRSLYHVISKNNTNSSISNPLHSLFSIVPSFHTLDTTSLTLPVIRS